MRLPQPLENLIDQLSKLPGIGPKTAQRLALYIMRMPRAEVQALASALLEMKKHVRPCSRCGNLTVADPCAICSDPLRDKSLLCVVEEASNIIALERTGYKGLYFVLNQDFNLMSRRNLQSLDFSAFFNHINNERPQEIVLALNPNVDGEIISRVLAQKSTALGIHVTRLAHGLPIGGDIEFADEITLRHALEGRMEIT